MTTELPAKSSRTFRIATIIGILVIGVVVIAMLKWRELSLKVPDFDDLQVAQANPFRVNYGGSSIEFFDTQGHRFQARVPSRYEMNQIKAALDQGVPVYIR